MPEGGDKVNMAFLSKIVTWSSSKFLSMDDAARPRTFSVTRTAARERGGGHQYVLTATHTYCSVG